MPPVARPKKSAAQGPAATSHGAKPQRPKLPKPSGRIDIRLRADLKEKLEHAAYLQNQSLTDFMVQSALAGAERAIEAHQVWTLSRRDAEIFIKALIDPPEPGERLKNLAKRYVNRYQAK